MTCYLLNELNNSCQLFLLLQSYFLITHPVTFLPHWSLSPPSSLALPVVTTIFHGHCLQEDLSGRLRSTAPRPRARLHHAAPMEAPPITIAPTQVGPVVGVASSIPSPVTIVPHQMAMAQPYVVGLLCGLFYLQSECCLTSRSHPMSYQDFLSPSKLNNCSNPYLYYIHLYWEFAINIS